MLRLGIAWLIGPVSVAPFSSVGLRFGIALRTRWLWLQATDPTRPWRHLRIPCDLEVQQIFWASTSWILGDGKQCRFWTDPWLEGCSISEIVPALTALVPRRRRRTKLVCEAIRDRAWISDIHGALGVVTMVEYVDVWRMIQRITLSNDPDQIFWRWTANGIYSASSCYLALFTGSVVAPFWRLIWKSWAPQNTKFFLWLASMDRCWTAERRARHGLPHDPLCVLCSQETETINHILAGCVSRV